MSGNASSSAGRPPAPVWPRVVLALAWPLKAVAVVALIAAAASVRVIASGEREIAASTEALRAGDAHEAIVRARRAAGFYAPGAPHVRVAYERLVAMGVAAEGLGDRETALLAWRGVRTAALETRWLLSPHADDLALADEAIARLSAAAPPAPRRATEPPATFRREQLEALSRDESPRVLWVAVLLASLGACAAGALIVARRAVSLSGHLSLRRAAPGLAALALGAALWVLALLRA